MLVTCPNCSTGFQVPDQAIGMKGRTVRCFRCKHQWHQPFVPSQPEARQKRPTLAEVMPERAPAMSVRDDPIDDGLLAAAMEEEARVEAGGDPDTGAENPFDRIAAMMMDQPPAPIPDVFVTPAEGGRPRRRGALALGLGALVVLLAAIAAGLYFFQDMVIDKWPPAAAYYQKLNVRKEVVGAAFAFRDYSSERVTQGNGEVLVVRGLIANITDQPHAIPLLRLALYDGKTQVQEKLFDPPQTSLEAHGTVSFRITLPQPDAHASRFDLTFSDSKMGASADSGATQAAKPDAQPATTPAKP